LLLLLLVFAAVQGMLIVELAPDAGQGDVVSVPEGWSWSEIVRDDGPIMERIPAPYVVFTVLTGAVVSVVGWYVLVRWTDISEAW
jgi:hypothetical protein